MIDFLEKVLSKPGAVRSQLREKWDSEMTLLKGGQNYMQKSRRWERKSSAKLEWGKSGRTEW